METVQLLILIVALAILAEVSYLVAKQTRQSLVRRPARGVLVDTSVLIDGRILPVVQTGFIGDTLIIPRSVIGELQFLADNADHEKRSRARYGLDVVAELQRSDKVDVQILQDGSKAEEGVDERLLKLAKKYNAHICTLDFNLSKVATVEDISILNLNELAQSIRMAYLPGERMRLELVQKGQDGHQAVGYLSDGTMVVVEHANKLIGQSADVEIIRSLQTTAGKMMFAKLIDQKPSKQANVKPTGTKPVQQLVQAQADTNDRQAKLQVRRQKNSRRISEPKPVQDIQPAPVAEQPVQPQTPRPPRQQKSRRPRTQADREAALLDLVDKQN
jgi:rRNA-processing protein FCF1